MLPSSLLDIRLFQINCSRNHQWHRHFYHFSTSLVHSSVAQGANPCSRAFYNITRISLSIIFYEIYLLHILRRKSHSLSVWIIDLSSPFSQLFKNIRRTITIQCPLGIRERYLRRKFDNTICIMNNDAILLLLDCTYFICR